MRRSKPWIDSPAEEADMPELSVTAVEMLADALRAGAKIRGHRTPIYRTDGSLEGYARQMIDVLAADIVTACDAVAAPDEKVRALRKGSALYAGELEKKVAVMADDLFHLVDAAAKTG